ncbi:MAG TPA: cysteine synthase family protein [Rhodothermales bacterium]|nr:cysteine synthase family protein [Rhodothermales bacterium]
MSPLGTAIQQEQLGRTGRGRLAHAVPEIARTIGNTPLLRLPKLGSELPRAVSVYAKAEFLNPGGSVKDRPAWAMIEDAIKSGSLDPSKTLLDATSGNTGIAYAMLCGQLGIRVRLAMPSNASEPRKRILRAYGAEVILTDPLEGTDGARRLVTEMVAANPELYYYADQYNNDANCRAHFETTGAEILQQTGGRVSHFVAALGTTGTFTGVARRLKLSNPETRTLAVQPDSALHAIEGLKHIASADVPGIFDPTLVDDFVEVSTEESEEMTTRLAREEGLFVGISSGANVAAALKVACELDEGIVVTVLCDSGARYLE